MANTTSIESLSREELIALLITQAEQIKELRRQIEELKRKAYRAAAPFSNGTPTQNPKRPGRKAVFTNRTAPAPETITTLTLAPVEATACPCCGGVREAEGEEFVTITDIPAIAHWLHYGIGVPQRKLPGVFKELFGLQLRQSALVQSAQQVAGGSLCDVYAALREALSTAAWVHSDDTGWSIAGRPAWLMSFSDDRTVVYQIRERHRSEDVREVIPSTFGGVLITDRFRS